MNRKGIDLLAMDIGRRCRKCGPGGRARRLAFFLAEPQYRTLFWWRLSSNFTAPAARGIFRRFYLRSSRRSGLEINTPSLGGGLIMPHWGRIILNAESIGDDLYSLHNVTVGNDYVTGRPVLGNDVFLGAGCSVLGSVAIGDHVVVAAGSVVVDDVRSCTVVAGNPARVVRDIRPDHITRMIGY
jgi:serine acetyltransferase